jgi:hypothetical protein
LLVRNIGGDIARFAGERQVDLIILEGGRAADGSPVLTKEERDIIARAGCAVAVVMPREALAERPSARAKP